MATPDGRVAGSERVDQDPAESPAGVPTHATPDTVVTATGKVASASGTFAELPPQLLLLLVVVAAISGRRASCGD